jgi:hypothetical protein
MKKKRESKKLVGKNVQSKTLWSYCLWPVINNRVISNGPQVRYGTSVYLFIHLFASERHNHV